MVLSEFTFPLSEGIAALKIPYPMSEDDFDFLIEALRFWKKNLIKVDLDPPIEPNENTTTTPTNA